MKLRNIKTTLENLNEAIKYVVFVLTILVIASIGLFFAQAYLGSGEIVPSIIFDIVFGLLILGMTVSSKGSVSLRRTTLLIIFGLLNTYGMVSYTFFYTSILVIPTQINEITQIMLLIGFIASILNVIILNIRAILLVQYDVCLNSSIDQLNKENFIFTLKEAIRALGMALPSLFLYGFMYQGFNNLLNFFFNLFDYQILVLENLILGILLIALPVAFIFCSRRFLHGDFKKSLGSAVFFAAISLICIICITLISVFVPGSILPYELSYTLVVGVLGTATSICVHFLNKTKVIAPNS